MKLFPKQPGFYREHRLYFIIPAYLVIGYLIYSNILFAPFVFDDAIYIVNNMLLRGLGNFVDVPWNRYLTYLTFALNYAVSGYDVFGYRLVNVLVHVANAVLVYLLVSLTFQTPLMKNADGRGAFLIALSTSLIFLVHPMQTQAVTYTTQRFASLAAFFYLLTMALYARRRLIHPVKSWPVKSGRFFYVAAVVSGALAQLSKENAFTLPVMLVVYEFAFFNSTQDNGLKRRGLRLAPFFALFAIVPLTIISPAFGKGAANYIRGLQMTEFQTLSSYEYLITEFGVVVTYLRLLIWPSGQRLMYEYPRYTSFFNYEVILPFIFLAVVFVSGAYLLISSRRKGSAAGLVVGFGILWFFITISVESSVVPIKDVIFEHRAYLPSAGVFMAAFAAFYYGFARLSRGGLAYLAVIAALAASLSVAAYQRNSVWSTRLSLWQDTASKAPNTPSAYVNLGLAYHHDAGNVELAEKNYRKALEIDPANGAAAFNLAILFTDTGRYEEALDYGLRLRAETVVFVNPYVAIAGAYAGLKRYDESIKNYKTAIKLEPDSLYARHGLAVVYAITGEADKAVEQLNEALRIAPYLPEPHYNLALLYDEMGKIDEAAYHLRAVLKINPEDREAREMLARLRYGR